MKSLKTDIVRDVKSNKTDPLVEDRIINNKELQAMLNVSRKTCQSWRDNRLITFSQMGRCIFYRLSDVNRMLDNHRRPAEKGRA